MWRRTLSLISRRHFSSEPEIVPLYSFLQPSIFALKRSNEASTNPFQKSREPTSQTLTQDHKNTLESSLQSALVSKNTDEAWKSFKTLTNCSSFPSKSLINSLISHLCSLNETHNLKRAFASVVYLIEKNPELLEYGTLETLLNSMKNGGNAAPVIALVKCMFKNRFFVPFSFWGGVLIDVSKKSGSLVPFLKVFNENCRIAVDEKLNFLKPNLAACNAALEGCCHELESVSETERVLEMMSVLGIRPDECSFGLLGYLYALKGLDAKISELEILIDRFGLSDRRVFFSKLISGYMKSGNLDMASKTILRSLKEAGEKLLCFSEETYGEVVKGYLQKGSTKVLANMIIEAQKLESSAVSVEKSIGYGIITACVNNGFLDKAHSILDEMNAQGASVGLGVYTPILKAYSKEQRTAEAAQLVEEINSSGLQLDVSSYDALIEASMLCQDFQSAFSLFRDMREARVPDLKSSYLTVMTGLTESHRPELMAAFLDEVVEDPRVQVGTHDWNSIIHAFCKAGRLEDARRTLRRMTFLQFEPNEQTYLSLINGYVAAEKYFCVLMLWHDVKKKVPVDGEAKFKFDNHLVDAFLYALVKGGFFDAVMQVVEKAQAMKIFVDKWRYKQAFMETHKKLKLWKLRKRNSKKMEAVIAFKNWAGAVEYFRKEICFRSSMSSLLPILLQVFVFLLLSQLLQANHAIPSIVPLNGTCHDTCGRIPIKFPFGSGYGCGHPDFARYIRCNSGVLQFSTGTGIYTVSSVDYSSNTILITDPWMSTCSSMQNSGSFRLDRQSPFSITADNIFVLLGCSTTSPVFDRNEDLCDTGSGSNICRGLYSCNAVTGIGLEPNAPISTCCVYEPPIPVGSGYGLDLPKLQCSSYSSLYGFGGDEGNPMKWQYGIPLQFNGSYYSDSCKNCEDSGGFCGFSGFNQSFACICRNGMNTTVNCFGRAYAWSGTWRCIIQTKLNLGGVRSHGVHPFARISVHNTVAEFDSHASIKASPTLLGVNGMNQEWINVEYQVSSPGIDDWIGVFSPANFSTSTCSPENPRVYPPLLCSAPIKFQYANYSSPNYKDSGKGSLKLLLINQRSDFSFALFSGGLSNPKLVAVSNRVSFANPDAPVYPRLAQGKTWDEMTVTWTSGYGLDDGEPFVEWGRKGEKQSRSPAGTLTFGRNSLCGPPATTVGWRDPGFIHTSYLKDLWPNVLYTYKLGHQLHSGSYIWSQTYEFRSSPYPGQNSLQRVVIFGDMGKDEADGSNEYNNFQYAALNTTNQLIKDLKNIDIVFHIGDIVYANGYLSQWDQFTSQVEPIASRVPYMVASGNHERDWPGSGSFYNTMDSGGECGVPAQNLFYVPAQSRAKFWYSTDYGMFRFCIADTENDWREGTEQYKFIENCLASVDRQKQPWLIFLAHRVLGYSSTSFYADEGSFAEPMGRESLQKLWQKYKVDIAIYGHAHNYERTCPIYQNICTNNEKHFYKGVLNATIHVVAGGGGAGLTQFSTLQPKWSIFRDYDYGFVKLTAFDHSNLLFEYKKSSDGFNSSEMQPFLILPAILLALLTSQGVRSHGVHPFARISVQKTVADFDSHASIKAYPTLLGVNGLNQEWVDVEYQVSNPGIDDWIGVFSPANFSAFICSLENPKENPPLLCSAPIKFQYANYSSPKYKDSGKGSLKLLLINQRSDFSFALFSGGLSNPKLVAVSNSVSFANPDAPVYPRLAQGKTWDEMTVTWTSGYGIDDAEPFVEWGRRGEKQSRSPAGTLTFGRNSLCGPPATTVGWRDPGFIHTSYLKDLWPNVLYTYKLGHQLHNGSYIWSQTYQFRSSPYPGQNSLQRVVIFGDMGKDEVDGSNEYNNFQYAALNTTNQLIKDLKNIDIVFHIGDIVYANGYLSQWDQFTSQVEPIASRVPYMVASGNHERDWPGSGSFYGTMDSGGECGVPAQNLFYVPAENRAKFWYSTDYGMFRFCIADSENDWREGTEQYKFIENCLASVDRQKQPWLIFLAHRVLGYSSSTYYAEVEGSFGEPMGRESLQKLWQKYKVDIAIYGHAHCYERTCPIYQNICTDNEKHFYNGVLNATIHVVAGGGGAGVAQFSTLQPKWSIFRDADYGFVKLTAFDHSNLLFEYKRSSDVEAVSTLISVLILGGSIAMRVFSILLAIWAALLNIIPGVISHGAHPFSIIDIHRAKYAVEDQAYVRATPLVLGINGQNKEWITLEFSVQSPAIDDWIGVFSPANFSAATCPPETPRTYVPFLCTAPIKFQYANYSNPDYINTGKGSLKLLLINQRSDFSFALFSGGLLAPTLVAVSNTIAFANPNAPVYPRLAQGKEWNEMTVTWTSGYGLSEAEPFIQWGLEGGEQIKSAAVTSTFDRNTMCGDPARSVGWRDPGFIHTGFLKELWPNLVYTYKLGHKLFNGTYIWSQKYQFRASPYPGQNSLQRVVIFGDMGKDEVDGSNEYNTFQPGSLNTTKQLVDDIDDIDIVFHIGDIVYAMGYLSQWDQFTSQIEPVASRVPYMIASGNHERDWPGTGSFYDTNDSGGECGVLAETMFYVPAENRAKFWYSTDYGMFRFCIADTEHDWREGTEQYKFIEHCLASVDRQKQPWLIFLAHRVLGYSSSAWYASEGTSAEPMGRESLQKLWQKYKVDVAIFGHVHNYERTCPVYENVCTRNEKHFYKGSLNGTIHVVAGGAGAFLSEFSGIETAWSIYRDFDHGFVKLTAFDHSNMLFEYKKSRDGKVYDSFRISRDYRDILACALDSCRATTLAT
ncbi:OLC1v1032622C1 [Oldenlandia corymbosa var. corymbosa]|uniref:Purple acid phosphatase n=1 Tax=Oldenlandia corymbosa var. corymbosa TaxID=529605 RepID=A0AAV1CN84_OLDCO|nr:OLC1v1032622C1 [Oldenlandia corymbosa var. corymbosa]